MHLPQWAAAVQHGSVQLGYKGVQRRTVIGGLGQRVEEHVLANIDVVGGDPMR